MRPPQRPTTRSGSDAGQRAPDAAPCFVAGPARSVRKKARGPRPRASWSELPVSRVLFPRRVTAAWVVVIPLGRASPRASSDSPGSIGRAVLKRSPIRSCSGWGLPCDRCYHRPGELLPRRFTLAATPPDGGGGGLLSVALSSGSPPPAVGWHPALWSSDFPPVRRTAPATTSAAPTSHDCDAPRAVRKMRRARTWRSCCPAPVVRRRARQQRQWRART